MIKLTEIHHIFESLGFSSYEARAYSALLKEFPLTGYKLSKISGVPRSRIYETLEKLSAKGFVFAQEGRPTTYIPIPMEELIQKTKRSFYNKTDLLRTWFDTLHVEKGVEHGIWNIEGRESILSKAEYMINNAAKMIAISGWAEDLTNLQAALERAAAHEIHIVVVSYGNFTSAGIDHVYLHSWENVRKIPVRHLTLVVDRSSALVGNTTPEEKCSAAWTKSRGVVFVAREHILHEVVINRLLNYIPPGIQRELMAFYNNSINR